MTTTSLNRGNEIQDNLRLLKNQIERLKREDYYALRELANNCSGRVYPELEGIDRAVREFSVKKVQEMITKLENEFKKL